MSRSGETGKSEEDDELPHLPSAPAGKTGWIPGGGSPLLPDLLRFGGVADYFLGTDRIHCRLHDPLLKYLVEIQFLGTVLALWLLRRQVAVLHASAVTVEGAGVAFVGEKGQGKTTLAAAMVARGHPLLADDLLALAPGDRGQRSPRAHSGIPLLRVTEAQIAGLGLPPAAEPVHPAFPKRKLMVGRGWGRFHSGPAPLVRVYLPQPYREGQAASGSIRLEHLPDRHSLALLLGHSFLSERLEEWGLAGAVSRSWFELATHHRFSLRRLHYPMGFQHLPAVVAAVEADLASEEGNEAE